MKRKGPNISVISAIKNVLVQYVEIPYFNPLTPISDQERISPYNIKTISSKQVMRIRKISVRGL